ncbi:MAG TPA: SHOCT domain-containing protein [Actinomycetota bacterium]|nr:SHOCT domain-containing protein [Actinomycetota bacterium]
MGGDRTSPSGGDVRRSGAVQTGLHESGALTDEEYAAAKARALGV